MLETKDIDKNTGNKASAKPGKGWIKQINPGKKELEALSQQYDIPDDFLIDPLDINEFGRVETHDGKMLIIARLPYASPDNPEIFTTLPVGVIFLNEAVITLCKRDIPFFDRLDFNKKASPDEAKARFMLQLLYQITRSYIYHLKIINQQSTALQRDFDKYRKNKQLVNLMELEKKLIFITTSLKSNDQILNRLKKLTLFNNNTDIEELMEDVAIENKQAIEMADIYRNILSKMMNSFSSIISNSLGAKMKTLTSVTIILMIPTLVASFYGMNIDLPFQGSSHAFTIVIGGTIILTLLGTLIFILRK